MTITPEEVARLAAAATPGPWLRDCWDILGKGTRHGGGTGHVCEVSSPNGDDDRYWNEGEADANVAFIAAAHDMAALIAELEAERDALVGVMKEIATTGRCEFQKVRAALAKIKEKNDE